MKWSGKKNFVLEFVFFFLIHLVSSSFLKSKQLSYKEQYEQCLEDYKMMYNSMNEKLKFYSDNENSLLDSVKGTIFKAYEKSQNYEKEKNHQNENFQNKIKNLEENLKIKENEINSLKVSYQKKIDDLNQEIKIKSSMIEKMSYDLKVSQEDNNILQKNSEKLAKEIAKNKLESFKIENLLSQQIKDCSEKLESINKNRETENQKDSDIIMLEMKNKIIKKKGITAEDILNQLTRGEKITTNLKLIEEKLSEFNNNEIKLNSTIIYQKEIDKESHKSLDNLIDKIKDKNSIDLNEFDDIQNKLLKRLDLILFNNIDKSRNIYSQLVKFNDSINLNIQQKENCQIDLKKVVGQNLELKEALAELEMKMRLTNYSKK